MSPYKELYMLLFNSMSDAIRIMQEAQIKAEEMFVTSEETNDATESK
jgi:hypothetical protein